MSTTTSIEPAGATDGAAPPAVGRLLSVNVGMPKDVPWQGKTVFTGLPQDAQTYLCGPAPFMQDISAGLAALGTEASHIHTEPFGPAPSMTPGIAAAPARPPHPPSGKPGTGPTIEFARSNLTVPWDAGYTNLLELAEAYDVPVRWSCRTGVCHTCETAVIAGQVDYSPDPVEPPADERTHLLFTARRRPGARHVTGIIVAAMGDRDVIFKKRRSV